MAMPPVASRQQQQPETMLKIVSVDTEEEPEKGLLKTAGRLS
jgi:hypothetical protein